MNTTAILILVLIVVVIAVGAFLFWQWRRSAALQKRFGPEYQHAVGRFGDQRKAEAELAAREKRVRSLEIRSLTPQEQARFAESRAEAMRKHADSAIHLEVRRAYLDLSAAAQRVEVASAAAAEAEEAHRIIQNRHQAGLITITELLRSEVALATARTRRLAAVYDHRIAVAALEHAAGTLAADSAAVN